MSFKVELYGNEFEREGQLKDTRFYNGEYTSLKIKRTGNGRVYFMALNKHLGGKVGMVNKQMQFVDGKVLISFGKNDKMEIGTYKEAS